MLTAWWNEGSHFSQSASSVVSSHSVTPQYGRRCVLLSFRITFLLPHNTMSTVLFLKSSLCRLPPRAVRRLAGCSYHTKKGVYGYRPKQSERDHKLQSDRIASLNQGQSTSLWHLQCDLSSWHRPAAVSVCSDHGLARLVEAYRAHGHKAAKINPLLPEKPVADGVPEIDTLAGTIRGQLNTAGREPPPPESE